MDEQTLVDLLIQNIQYQLRHPHYDRTIEVRKFARRMITGLDQGAEITKYRRGEDKELKDQREHLTNTLTKYSLNRLRKYLKKVANVKGVKSTYTTKNKAVLQKMHDQFERFFMGYDLRGFLTWKLEYFNSNDPNGWIIYEREDIRDAEGGITKTEVYPFIVSCVDALNFEYRRGTLQWLIVRQVEIETTFPDGTRRDTALETYYLYAPGVHIRLREVGELTLPEQQETLLPIEVIGSLEVQKDPASGLLTTVASGGKKKRDFLLTVLQNGTTEVPALRCGAYVDDQTEQMTYVAWFDPAEHVLQDLIKTKMFSDVDQVLNNFRKRAEFVRGCKYVDPVDRLPCSQGFLGRDPNRKCPSCNGTGQGPNFTSDQQILQIVWPEGAKPEELVDLAKLSFTEDPQVEFSKWLHELVDIVDERVMKAVLAAGVLEQATGKMTDLATPWNYAYQDLNDWLRYFATCISQHYELAYRVSAQYRGVEDYVGRDEYPEDFKMQQLNTMLDTFQKMRTAGVGYGAMKGLRRDIFEKQYQNDPVAALREEARYEWLPFDDKSETEVAMIMAALSPSDYFRVLRTYWLEIFNEIEKEDKEIAGADDNPNDSRPEFYQLTRALQKAVVDRKVKEYTARIEQASAAEPDLGNAAADGNQDTQPTAQ